MSNILVIYHNNCVDGLAAAWVCSKHLAENNNVTYLPYNYHTSFPVNQLKDCNEIYIVDFSFPLIEMESILLDYPTKYFTLIDHHETAKELGKLRYHHNFNFRFSIEHSGCVLTHYEFEDAEPCLLLQYIQDRDLWTYKLLHSKAINAYIRSLKPSFSDLDTLCLELQDNDVWFDNIVKQGQLIFDEQYQFICSAIEDSKVFTIQFGNYIAPCVQLPKPTNGLTSEIIEALYLRYNSNYAVGYSYIENNTKIRFEFRSPRTEFGLDVSKLAKQYNGGGHRNSSGTVLLLSELKDYGIILKEG